MNKPHKGPISASNVCYPRYSATSSKEAILVEEVGTGRFGWKVCKEPYTCTVGVAKKGAKFAGLKPFMNYPLTPSFSNIQVRNG